MEPLYEKQNVIVINKVYNSVSKKCEYKDVNRCKHPDRVFTTQRCYADYCAEVHQNLEVVK